MGLFVIAVLILPICSGLAIEYCNRHSSCSACLSERYSDCGWCGLSATTGSCKRASSFTSSPPSSCSRERWHYSRCPATCSPSTCQSVTATCCGSGSFAWCEGNSCKRSNQPKRICPFGQQCVSCSCQAINSPPSINIPLKNPLDGLLPPRFRG